MSPEVVEIKSKFFPHLAQQKIRESNARFRIVIAGRRFGKSVLAVNECIEYALANPGVKVWYCSPFYKQTKEIAWNIFKFYLPQEFIEKVNESELKFQLVNGSEISLKGTDNPDALVGVGLKFVVLDEFALMKDDIWKKIIRPMLIDSKGRALFISTPRGFNWAYDLYKEAQRNSDEWDTFQFRTVDNTTVSDIETEVNKAKAEATSELDRITFRQEYEATFEVVTGRPRFSIDAISKLVPKVIQPTLRGDNLNVLHPLDPASKYIIGVDTSEGLISGDRSTAIILDARTFTVAAYYAGHMAPDLLGIALADWAKEWNGALVVVEDNNHGLVTLNELKQRYQHLYYRKVKDEVTDEWTDKLGWRTTPRTKPMLIGNLDKQLRAGLVIEAKEILDELMTYIIEEDGKTNASEGCHDDLVMGLACAVQGYVESSEFEFKPATPPVPDGTPQSYLNKVLNNLTQNVHGKHRFDGDRKRA